MFADEKGRNRKRASVVKEGRSSYEKSYVVTAHSIQVHVERLEEGIGSHGRAVSTLFSGPFAWAGSQRCTYGHAVRCMLGAMQSISCMSQKTREEKAYPLEIRAAISHIYRSDDALGKLSH